MMQHWMVENSLSGGGFAIEMRRYNWPTPYEDILEENAPVLGLYLENTMPVGEIRPLAAGSKYSPRQVGRIVFTPPRIPFEVRGSGGGARVICFSLNSDLFERLSKDALANEEILASCSDVRGTAIGWTLMRLAGEMASPGFANDLLVESAGTMITIELARFFQETEADAPRSSRTISSTQLNRIIDIVQSGAPFSIKSMALECGTSPRSLLRNFKATTGRTIGDFVKEVRINHAKNLLCDRTLSIKEIAFKTGFAQSSGFCTAFRNATGTTPRKYRLGKHQ